MKRYFSFLFCLIISTVVWADDNSEIIYVGEQLKVVWPDDISKIIYVGEQLNVNYSDFNPILRESEYTTSSAGTGDPISHTLYPHEYLPVFREGTIMYYEGENLRGIRGTTFRGSNIEYFKNMPNSLESIGDNTFEGCTQLTSFPKCTNIRTLGRACFKGCTKLTNISLATILTTIGPEVFSGCENLKSCEISPIAVFYSIPDTMFYGCRSLESITIPISLKAIGKEAFSGCTRLMMIDCYAMTPPAISDDTFNGVPENAVLWVPEGYKKLYEEDPLWGRFKNHIEERPSIIYDAGVALKSVSDNEECGLHPEAFDQKIKYHFHVASTRTGMLVFDGRLNTIGERAFYGAEVSNVTIPRSVKSLGKEAFKDCKYIKNLILPDSLTSLGVGTFDGCVNIKDPKLPQGIIDIPERCFANCEEIRKIQLSSSLRTIGKEAFSGCYRLEQIDFPPLLCDIGTGAFNKCYNLYDIDCFLEKSFPLADKNVFSDLRLSPKMTVIPDAKADFENAEGWNNLQIRERDPNHFISYSADEMLPEAPKKGGFYTTEFNLPMKYHSYNKETKTGTISFNDDVTTIRYSAFEGCTGLKGITLPASVDTIQSWAFRDCSGLKVIPLPGRTKYIGDSAFEGCTSLSSLYIPESVDSLGTFVFRDCTSLTDITLPALRTISQGLFRNCSTLPTVTIPDSVRSIHSDAFKGCLALNSIVLPDELNDIGFCAFDSCVSLTQINLPCKLTSLSHYVFYGCSNLKTILCETVLPPVHVNDSTFTGLAKDCEFQVYRGTMDNWKTSACIMPYAEHVTERQTNDYITYWATNKLPEKKIPYNEGLFIEGFNTKIKHHLIGVDDFAEVHIGVILFQGDVNKIGMGAFKGCKGLTDISYPSTVTDIYEDAFLGCDSLKEDMHIRYAGDFAVSAADRTLSTYSLKEGTRWIGLRAFEGCSKLASITIPESVQAVGANAFKDCPSLYVENGIRYAGTYLVEAANKYMRTYKIKEGTRWIGTDAFKDCNVLSSIICTLSILPECDDRSFESIDTESIVVYLSREGFERCNGSSGWSRFNHIIFDVLTLSDSIPDLPDGTHDIGSIFYNRSSVKEGTYGTYCLPFDTEWSTSEFSHVYMPMGIGLKDNDTLRILLDEYTDKVIPAGTPFLAKHAAPEVTLFNSSAVTFDSTIDNPEPTAIRIYEYTADKLVFDTDAWTVTWGGTIATKPHCDGLMSFNTNGNFGPHSGSLRPFRAYLTKVASVGEAAPLYVVAEFLNDDEEGATGISELKEEIEKLKWGTTTSSGTTRCKQGIYSLDGHRIQGTIETLPKGIYIINGQKVIK